MGNYSFSNALKRIIRKIELMLFYETIEKDEEYMRQLKALIDRKREELNKKNAGKT